MALASALAKGVDRLVQEESVCVRHLCLVTRRCCRGPDIEVREQQTVREQECEKRRWRHDAVSQASRGTTRAAGSRGCCSVEGELCVVVVVVVVGRRTDSAGRGRDRCLLACSVLLAVQDLSGRDFDFLGPEKRRPGGGHCFPFLSCRRRRGHPTQ
jgi:hypothetical protein